MVMSISPLRFQFTHPGKGATFVCRAWKVLSRFQFTHPGKGATGSLSVSSSVDTSFNSRTLGRVRPRTLPTGSPTGSFNSRTLGRVRRSFRSDGRVLIEFQFTHPGKGATSRTHVASPHHPPFQFTHPGKGATLPLSVVSPCVARFNSRTLGRVRRASRSIFPLSMRFQFTHPGKGAT